MSKIIIGILLVLILGIGLFIIKNKRIESHGNNFGTTTVTSKTTTTQTSATTQTTTQVSANKGNTDSGLEALDADASSSETDDSAITSDQDIISAP